MALGTPVLGTSAVVQVGTTSNPTTPVGGLVSWTYGVDTPTTARNYYGQASVNTVGKANRTIQFTLDYETGDSGQLILAAAVISKATIYARILPDGTNGEILPVKVSGGSIAGPDVNGFSTVSYTLAQQADPTIVGGGFGT
jgi:hypothetical protein